MLDVRYIPPSWNHKRSKIIDVENPGQILDFLTPVKIGEGWAKCLSLLYDFGLGANSGIHVLLTGRLSVVWENWGECTNLKPPDDLTAWLSSANHIMRETFIDAAVQQEVDRQVTDQELGRRHGKSGSDRRLREPLTMPVCFCGQSPQWTSVRDAALYHTHTRATCVRLFADCL